MSRAPFITPGDLHIQTVLRDRHGTEVYRTDMQTYTIRAPDGNMTTFRVGENIGLTDGTEWNPSMSMRQQDPIDIAVCETCRRPPLSLFRPERPSHGLCNAAKAKNCADCGDSVCPRHCRQGPDRRFRCLRCASRDRIKRWIRPIFFGREEV